MRIIKKKKKKKSTRAKLLQQEKKQRYSEVIRNYTNKYSWYTILLKLPIKSYSNIKERFNKRSFYNCKFTSEYHSSFLISKCDILVKVP